MRKLLLIAGVFALLCTARAVTPDVSTTAPAGKEVDATVTLASGTTPFTYQWKKDGVALPAQTAATLAVVNAQPIDSGRYTVTVSNSLGSTDSLNGLVLTVTPPPAPPSGAVVQPASVK